MKRFLKNKKGFSLLELMISLGIFVFLMAQFLSVLLFNQKSVQYELQKTDGLIDEQQVRLVMFQDLVSTQSSFGVLSANDDNGNNFFDLYYDYSSALLPAGKQERVLTFSANNPLNQHIAFLYSDKEAIPIQINASSVYTYSQASAITVNGGQLKTAVTDSADWWVKDNLLFIYAPAYLRSRTDNSNAAPRLFHSIFKIDSSAATTLSLGDITGFTDSGGRGFHNPTYDSTAAGLGCPAKITTITEFFKCMPLFGGNQDLVFARKTLFLVYRMIKTVENGYKVGRLYRCLGDGTKISLAHKCGESDFPGAFLMSAQEVKFERRELSEVKVALSITPPTVEKDR